jgi:N-acyl-D-aspartate/D-glutamate deacylase
LPVHDLVVRAGSVVDGTGAPARSADIAVDDGRITAVGSLNGVSARHTIDADGALVTPGWVDIHTHYDGQATWDEVLAPSAWHGVTTIVTGNCGVGFAPGPTATTGSSASWKASRTSPAPPSPKA